jgi:hypothetical protein
MPEMLPSGLSGLVVSWAVLGITWLITHWTTLGGSFDFDSHGEKGAFEKLLPLYLDLAKFILGLASGSIVLLVGSAAFRSNGRLPAGFAEPLFLLGMSVVYGILFMVFLVT